MIRTMRHLPRLPHSRSHSTPIRTFTSLATRQPLLSTATATPRRTYATEAQPPSPNDLFANGGNAYYAEE